ncbi:nuclear transport factor 2 family protein [Herbiconiux liangxiaofengii]|uniref:nuclear transport factor 2 family protein n=1 Tax=Herbiconiux liangxiaofengii TaxID=3342795 RepID=UPI0035B81E66
MTDADRLPPAIAAFFDASNADDRDRFLAAFAPDAVLDDWGHTFTGREGVAAWNESDNMGVGSRFTVEGVTEHNGVHAVSVQVTGGGYNGRGTMAFVLDGDLISRVDITG